MTHSTDKLYRCVYCLDSFVWRASLDSHMKKSHPLEWEGEKATGTSEDHSKSIEIAFDQEQEIEN